MAYTTIDNPELYFQCKIYTGDGNTGRSITFDNTDTSLQPDLAWFKNRDDADHFGLVDSVRGVTKRLSSNDSFAEQTDANNISAFNSNGFSISASSIDNMTNTSGEKYVFWCWKESTTAGLDIVTYTGNDAARTISHNLGVTPAVLLLKKRSGAGNWALQHQDIANTKFFYLNTNGAAITDTWFNNSYPNSSTFSVDGSGAVNLSGSTIVGYVFAEIKGFSKHGSFTGNANTNGSFIYTGFKPAWVMIKNSNASEHWRIYDNKRDTFNHMFRVLFPNEGSAESTVDNGSEEIDFLSNGFKIRSNAAQLNGSGNTLIYMSFAESPFVNSNEIPTTAR